MHVTNTYKGPLGLPTGQELPSGVATPVHNWDTIKKNAVVQAWLKAGILVEGETSAAAADATDKDELVAKLAALGVKHHPNTGVPKLQALLDEAEEKKRAEDDVALANLVFEMSGLSVEAWQALPEKDRTQRIADHRASLEAKD